MSLIRIFRHKGLDLPPRSPVPQGIAKYLHVGIQLYIGMLGLVLKVHHSLLVVRGVAAVADGVSVVEVQDAEIDVLVDDQAARSDILVHDTVDVVELIDDIEQLAELAEAEGPRGSRIVQRASQYEERGRSHDSAPAGL
ncbi:hypothetical protein VTK73DRAFT_7752 [Phialemonium thermophilum]|uniref:Uncharacterized protein n=1 Tax=Phialemonium thermophilum TaxID=223376 RepID=A0ABR3XRG8_9PEZI